MCIRDRLATQQSIKAYVDSQVTAQDLDVISDSGTIDIDLDSESLTIAGGSGIDTSATSTTLTIAGEDATTSNKGVASFHSDNFAVSSGAVTIKDAGVADAELADMPANTVKVRDANSTGVPANKTVADTQVLIGDGTGFTAAALSGDATMTNAGAVTVAKIQGTAVSSTAPTNDQYMKYSSSANEWQMVSITGTDKLTTKGDLLVYNTVDSETRLPVGTNKKVITANSSATNGLDWQFVDGESIRMGSDAAGDTVYFNGTDYARLAKGSASQVLTMNSGATAPEWAAAGQADMAANTVKVRDASSSGAPSDKAVADTQILIGDGTGFTAAALSGNATMTNTGAVTVTGFVSETGATGSAELPVGTTAQRDGSPSNGYMRYNTTTSGFEGYSGSASGSIGGGATGAGGDAVFYENEQTVTTDYTITTNMNAMSAGPVTVASGITVTIPSGSAWVVV